MDQDVKRLTLHQLRVFRTVVRHLNFTRAAAELRLTQSAVSAQVRELTSILGTPLFEILGRKVHLTDAGRLLEAQAALIEGLVNEIAQHFVSFRDAESGLIRVGASTSVGTYVIPRLLAAFSALHPRIEITLEIQNTAFIEERLLRNEFDLGFIGSPATSPELVAEPFLEDEILFACAPGHPLAGKTAVAPERLARERLIVREPGSATRRTMEEQLRRRGIGFAGTVQLGAVEAIKQAVMAGLGIAYFSALTVRHELETGRLAPIRVRDLAVTRAFLIVRHRRKGKTPLLRSFLAFTRTWRADTG